MNIVIPDFSVPYTFRYLRDEDDGVSETIIDFAVQYVGVLKVIEYYMCVLFLWLTRCICFCSIG